MARRQPLRRLAGRRALTALTLLVNPHSGRGRAGRLAPAVAARLQRAGHRVRAVAGRSAAESAALASVVLARREPLIVLGGDGLLHHLLPVVAGTGSPVGLVPAGTGNDAATAFGVPGDPFAATDAVTDALAAGSTAAVDLGVATAADRRETPFATVLCWGFDAAVAELGARLPWPRGPRRYDLAIAAHTLALRHRPVEVVLDDAPATTTTALLVAVGNGGWYGGGKRMVPQASPEDGRLGVTVVGPVTRRLLARMAPTLPHAGHVGHPAVTVADAERVRLTAPGSGIAAWADGERVGPLPLAVTTARGALTLLRAPWCTPPEPTARTALSASTGAA
ncbi:diacylglycerol kinase family protein [Jatrophihabitans sp. YIM 134969]